MTDLADRIHALTGAEDETILRAIDAEVADLIGWWPENTYVSPEPHWLRVLLNEEGIPYRTLKCPHFTTLLEATLAEIRVKVWFKTIDDTNFQVEVDIWELDRSRLSQFKCLAHVCREGQNDALAVLEAFVLAAGAVDAK